MKSIKQMQLELLNRSFKATHKDGKLWPQPFFSISGAMLLAQDQKEYDQYHKREAITIISCLAGAAILLPVLIIWF